MKQLFENNTSCNNLIPYQTLETPRQKFVVLGGGTGIVPVLQGLREQCYPEQHKPLSAAEKSLLTAIVTVADDGGSTGALRKAYPMLAPGDIRNCLSALAGNTGLLHDLFDFRFNSEMGGHSLGNLILTAIAQIECDFARAVDQAAEILDVKGRVLPVTTDDVNLQAIFSDGSSVKGESSITAARRRIQKVSLVPPTVRMLPQVSVAIAEATTIVIGPGSLYTSLIPVLLVPGVADAIAASRATVVLVMNLMTEPGETDYYDPADVVYAFRCHVPQMPIHYVLVNNAPIRSPLREHYAAEGAHPITLEGSRKKIDAFSLPLNCDLLAEGEKVRHDPAKLARMIMELGNAVISRKGYDARVPVMYAG